MTFAPRNINLNVAAMLLAHECWPQGFDTGPVGASTLEALKFEVNERGRLTIWNGACERTVFGCPEVNLHFRAWHDWAHFTYDLPFTVDGETAAAFVQAAQICRRYGPDRDMVQLLFCEVIGQALWYEGHKEFPEDQRKFADQHLGAFWGLAEHFVNIAAAGEITDRQAIRIAWLSRCLRDLAASAVV